MGTVYSCPFRKQVESATRCSCLLSHSSLLLAVSAEYNTTEGYGESGYGSMYDGYGYGSGYGDIWNETWDGYGSHAVSPDPSGHPWPEDMHCCKCKSVGHYKYYLVDYQEAEGWKKEGMMLPRKCYNGCIYTMDMDTSGDLYCFARGRQDVMCYDDDLGGYGSGMGSGYPVGSGSGGMGSGYPMGSGSGMGSGYGMEHGSTTTF